MSLRGTTEDSTTRAYVKSGIFSKKEKPPSYYSYGNFEDIMLSIKKFDEWLNKSRKNDKIMYYRGFLFAPNQQKLSPTLDFKRVEKLAEHVRNIHHGGTITMVQKRHDDFDYEYWAVRV